MRISVIALITVVCVGSIPSFAQSHTFQTLRERFGDYPSVFGLRVSGTLTRAVLRIADEDEYNRALEEVKNIRVVVIPHHAFHAEKVTLNGFIKFAEKESFEKLARVRDGGDDITLLLQENENGKDNRYLMLVNDKDAIVVAEIKGYIDVKYLFKDSNVVYY